MKRNRTPAKSLLLVGPIALILSGCASTTSYAYGSAGSACRYDYYDPGCDYGDPYGPYAYGGDWWSRDRWQHEDWHHGYHGYDHGVSHGFGHGGFGYGGFGVGHEGHGGGGHGR